MVGCAIGSTDRGLTGNDSIRYVPVASGAGIPPFPVTDWTIDQLNYVLLDLGILLDGAPIGRVLQRDLDCRRRSGGCGTGGNGWRRTLPAASGDTIRMAWRRTTTTRRGRSGGIFFGDVQLQRRADGAEPPVLLEQAAAPEMRGRAGPARQPGSVRAVRDDRGAQLPRHTWSQACVNQVASVCGAACATFNPNTQVTTAHCTASIFQVQTRPTAARSSEDATAVRGGVLRG